MKLIGAYLLATLGGNASPSADDVKKILGSVGIEADDEQLDKLISQLDGKDIAEVIAEGASKLSSLPSGGGAAPAAAAAAPAAGGAAKEAPKKEEKKEEKEESDDVSFLGLESSGMGVWMGSLEAISNKRQLCLPLVVGLWQCTACMQSKWLPDFHLGHLFSRAVHDMGFGLFD
ncbi:60S acidic ribosomal protein P2 [Phlyctochytrium planicorne]|nr:60S acidic ribosomal protein P2 [Phlyctochytrium planicorne]